MSYHDYIIEKVIEDRGIGWLTTPVVGWLASAYLFGIVYPVGYIFRKRPERLCPDCQKNINKKNVPKKKSHRNSLQ